ncbi:FHA domain-containing protein, partial [Cryobacterium sp. TMT2-10]
PGGARSSARAARGAGRGPTAAILRVMSGPDKGAEFRLPVGNSTIGRIPGNDVVLNDELVSKRHVRVEVGPGSIEIVDLNSANGILVDGGLLSRVRLVTGQSIVLGDTELAATLVAGAPVDQSVQVLERGGSLRFNRSPQVEQRYPGREFPAPAIPTDIEPQPFPWLMVISPAIMGIVMFAVTRNPLTLTFVAMMPMMAVGSHFSRIQVSKNKLATTVTAFETQLEDIETRFEEEEPLERASRLRESPSVAEVYGAAIELGPLLWTRRPEHWNFLDLRLGLGSMPSRNTINTKENTSGLPVYLRMVDKLQAKVARISGVPVVENLFLSGALGVCGPATDVADTVRAITVQYAGMHSPAEVTFAAILSPRFTTEFEWLKWLPHTSSPQSRLAGVHLANSAALGTAILNALEELIQSRNSQNGGDGTSRGSHEEGEAASQRGTHVGQRTPESSSATDGAALVVLIDNDAPVDRARLAQMLEDAADARIYPIWMAPNVEALPAACRTFVNVENGLAHAEVGFVRLGMTVPDVTIEGVSVEYARILARRLAPIIDAGAVIADASDLPRSVSMVTLMGEELASEPGTAIERWTQNSSISDRSGAAPVPRKRTGTLRAIVGQSALDAMHLDLRTQGPHALVGGTTGSGKSEFLQAWVLGMAAEYSPDRVTFLFVDYKGGSAFAECTRLPHCVGLVTDLSPHLVRRALTSLRAELHYREHLFNRKKAKDLLELEKRGDPDCPPALVLVIDEFAALAGEVPEFVDGVVDIAQRGRSLGIHLIMATQRPAGVIKDNLRANTNLRVALRMADESDSKDVVGDPIAGTFDPSIPGRAIAKTGPGRLIPFQSGYAGGWTTDEPDVVSVKVGELRFGSQTPWEAPAHESNEPRDLGPNDQVRIVSNLITAAARAGIPAPRRPWLDDLLPAYDLLALRQGRDSMIVMGVSDIPEKQLQEPAFFRPDKDGHMAIYGTGGTGKSALLRTLAISAGASPGSGAVNVYGIDFGTGSLRGVEVLPHVGSIVSGDDHERVGRLLLMLRAELDARALRFSEVNAASIGEYRELAKAPGEARILFLLDGFGTFRQEYETSLARGPLYNTFMRILGEGRPLGIHVVITADRYGSVPTAVNANIQRRVVLRLPDESSYQVLDVPKDVLSEQSPPGRAIVDGYETQLAIIGGTPNVAAQTTSTQALAARLRAAGVAEAPVVGALPKEVSLRELPASVNDLPVIGISDTALQPMGFEPMGTIVIGGPPVSGKTNTIRALVRTIAAWDPDAKFFHIGGRRSQLATDYPWMRSAVKVDDAVALVKELIEAVTDEGVTDRLVIVIENVTQFAASPLEKPLVELAQKVNRSDHTLITDVDIANLGSSFGLVGEMKAARKGIILKPDTHDGESVFKVPFPRVARHEFPEGRGLYVQNGSVYRVQIPLVADSLNADRRKG